MNKEQADALRKPFPKETIGVLPKPYKRDSPKSNCPECGSYHGMPAVHLDYVGHAATTDRLLSVDPEWSWEPVGVDQYGNPQPDAGGNLWIRLTVCGVTRLGVGDGANMKERIGDAIRNAAMRFGVALDLWSKEELEGAHVEAEKPERKAERVHEPQVDQWTDPVEQPVLPMSDRSRARMFALFAERGIDDAAQQRDGIEKVLHRPITSRGEISEGECQEVIKSLLAHPKPAAVTS